MNKAELAFAVDNIYQSKEGIPVFPIIAIAMTVKHEEELFNLVKEMLEKMENGEYNRDEYIDEEWLEKQKSQATEI